MVWIRTFHAGRSHAGSALAKADAGCVSQVPIQAARFINYSLLSKEERRWLRVGLLYSFLMFVSLKHDTFQLHNKACLENLTPLIGDDKRAMKWLRKQTGRVGPIEIIWE